MAHPKVLLPMIFGEDGNARRTLVAKTQGNASDARRASCDHVVEAAETNHAAVVGPERSSRNWIPVIHNQYAKFLGGFVESDGGIQFGLYEVASGSALARRWRGYADWPPARCWMLHLLKSSEPFSGFRFSHSRVFYWGLLPRCRCECQHGRSRSSPCVPWSWPLLRHQNRSFYAD